ncbi:uncharacterized protein LOC126657795 [Mercurialis annua]|uniref:uncharacterized protein LOC126657795 n=1 Tax=Mercurialis annua TaxID=3986 RepID=UPI0024AEA6AE|nr:uncharacterized protein LOC126657795 [Mercurialis annua]
MLACQLWRLLKNRDSLCFKVLLAKYFPSGSFFDASIGTNPSYIWRSLFATHDLMRRGVRKVIGPDEAAPKGLINTIVNQLLEPNLREWDLGLLNDMFSRQKVERILKVPLFHYREEDYWTWSPEKRGNHSVKTGYRLLHGEIVESVEHVLYHCHVARNCWRRLGVQVPDDDSEDIKIWLYQTLNSINNNEKNDVAMVCWKLWLHHNDVVWNDKWSSLELIVNSAASDLAAWQFAQKKNGQQLSSSLGNDDGLTVWRAPSRGWLKANVSASVFLDESGIGVSCVIRDDDGRLLQARTAAFQGSSSA